MIGSRHIGLFALLMWVPLLAAAADEQRPLREARSENGQYLLRVEAGRPGRAGHPCEATLYAQAERGAAKRRAWQRTLVNDTAPVLAFVRNDGHYVVTLDEYRRGGARNAVVIYGAEGELLRHFLLPDLLGKPDWAQVKTGRHELNWLDGARCVFDDAAEQFVINLKWGRRIRIDLRTLRVVREGETTSVELAAIPAAILNELLTHAAADTARTPADRLAELAQMTPAERAQADAIAAQLAADRRATETAARPEATTQAAPGELEVVGKTGAVDERAGNAAPPAIQVPPPDAASKVNYLNWFNQFGQVEGPDANPVYEAAIAALVPWAGSDELFRAAERGDPEALSAPEIDVWLTANATALARFGEATQFDAKGWSRFSADGSLIGVVLPELSELRQLGKLSLLAGRRAAADGRPDEAAQRYLDVLAAGTHLHGGLTLIEQLVGTALQARGAEALLDLQADPAASALDSAALAAESAAAVRPARPLTDALQTERAMFMDVVQRSWDYDAQAGRYTLNVEQASTQLAAVQDVEAGQVAGLAAQLASAGYESTVAEGNLYYDALTEALSRPYPEAVWQLQQLEAMLGESGSVNPFLRTLTPSMERCLLIQTRGAAAQRAALLVANLRAYRQEHGKYPESLAAVRDPALTIDPFSAAPFVYRRVGADFALYSVGANGTDDAGVHDPKAETNDLLFWPRPR
jgi:hypothetical protein